MSELRTRPETEAALASAEPSTVTITLDARFSMELQQAAHAVGLTPQEWAQVELEGGIRLFNILGAQIPAERVREQIEARKHGGKRHWERQS